VALSSGSAALYLALLAADVRGERVAAPAYSCRALLNAIQLAGGEPEWMDVDRNSPNVNRQELPGTATRTVIVAHMFGIPAELPNDSMTIIEDCAQALGAERGRHKVGTLGKIGVFSFAATKLITTGGQGGMLVSRDPGVIDFVRKARDYDTVPDAHPRFNFQMTDLQAAVGRRQLARLPEFLSRRERTFGRYQEAGAELLDGIAADCRPIRFRAVMRTVEPLEWQKRFAAAGIRTIIPITEDELLTAPKSVPHAAALCRETLSLPIHPALADEDVDRIVRELDRSVP
jgi:perosamine synthetase